MKIGFAGVFAMWPKRHQPNRTVPVWDLPTRLFHWLLASLVAVAWMTAETEGALFQVHIISGYCVLTLIAFRLVWGIIGSPHSRFSDFVRPWPVVRDYAARLLRLSPPRHLGHNPLGGWMVVALIAALAVVTVTGLFTPDDGNADTLTQLLGREASHAMEEMHEGASTVLLFLITVHVAGVFAHMLVTGDNLIRAMWSGRKEAPAGPQRPESRFVAPWRAVLAVTLSAGLVWTVVA